MSIKARYVVVPAVLLLMAIFVGCSSSDSDKGTGSKLSNEQQFELLTTVVDTSDVGTSMMPLALGLVGGAFWDGVDPDDYNFGNLAPSLFPGFGAPRSERRIPGSLAKQIPSGVAATYWLPALSAGVNRALADADSLIINYDAERGWWIATFDMSINLDTIGGSGTITVALRDSIRFDNSQTGTPTMLPVESTDRFQRGTYLDAQIVDLRMGEEDGEINAGIRLTAEITVTDLDESVVTANGNSGVTLTVDASILTADDDESPMTVAANGSLEITSEIASLVVPVSGTPDEVCPTSGSVDVGVVMDLHVASDDMTGDAVGSWDVSMVFTGNGMAQVVISSDGFNWSQTDQVCQP